MSEEESIENNKLIERLDLFGDRIKPLLKKLGFTDEKEMLKNLGKLTEQQLSMIIMFTLDNFSYDEDEMQKIILYLFRGVFV